MASLLIVLTAVAYVFSPIFGASFYDEYRDNDRYSWLFYRFKEEGALDAYQSAIINLGWFEVPSLAIFYSGAQFFEEFGAYSAAIFYLTLILLAILGVQRRLSIGSLLIVVTSTYFFRLSIDLHKLQLAYFALLGVVGLKLSRAPVALFHFSWVVMYVADLVTRMARLGLLLRGRFPRRYLMSVTFLFALIFSFSDGLYTKAIYYLGDIHFLDVVESVIFSLGIFLAFPARSTLIICLLVSIFALFVGSDRLLILIFLWFFCGARKPEMAGVMFFLFFNAIKWFLFLGSDFNVFSYSY